MSNFQEWREWRQFHESTDVVPEDLPDGRDPEALIEQVVLLYGKETRRQDGKPSPSRTINVLLSA